jgi:hypothetical protein
METAVDDFLADMLPKQVAAETAIHSGDVAPRLALWSRNDPVTLFGAKYSGTGWAELDPMFHTVASWFSDSTEYASTSWRRAPVVTWPTRSATSATTSRSTVSHGPISCVPPTCTGARVGSGESCTDMLTFHQLTTTKALSQHRRLVTRSAASQPCDR